MDERRAERGLTWVSFLLLVLVVAGAYWAWVFGPAYLDNASVKQICATGANLAYTERNDATLRAWLYNHIREQFAYDYMQANGMPAKGYKIEFEPSDVRLERTAAPALIRIDISYSRTIALPIVGGARTLVFNDHAEQDLSPVKW
jgi:hypothetical protein